VFERVNGRNPFVVDAGSGDPPLVLHSGWIGTWEDWLPQLEAVSRRRRVIAFDHRGTGRSAAAVEDISFDALVDDVFALLDALDISTCVLGGFSSGTAIVHQAILRDPQRFQGLVLMCPNAAEGRPDQQFVNLLRTDFDAAISGFLDGCLPEALTRDVGDVRRWASDVLHQSQPEQAVRLMEIMRPQAPLTALPAELPGLVIIGSQDLFSPPSSADRWKAILPQALVHIVEGAGHIVAFTGAASVNNALIDFLESSAPTT
jgi:pimeloyl-ACP methyl ester carboxylesterase